MENSRRNKNRGYQQLRVWSDSIELYAMTCRLLKNWPFELKKVAGQAIASADSVQRNVAEGYCRRSIREYIQFLYIALGSAGESVSGFEAFREAGQISESEYAQLDEVSYRLENRLLKLTEQLERKRNAGDWTDTLVVEESPANYDVANETGEDLGLLLENSIAR